MVISTAPHDPVTLQKPHFWTHEPSEGHSRPEQWQQVPQWQEQGTYFSASGTGMEEGSGWPSRRITDGVSLSKKCPGQDSCVWKTHPGRICTEWHKREMKEEALLLSSSEELRSPHGHFSCLPAWTLQLLIGTGPGHCADPQDYPESFGSPVCRENCFTVPHTILWAAIVSPSCKFLYICTLLH